LIAKVNNQKNSDMKNLFAINMGKRHPIFKHQNIRICGRLTKLRRLECKMLPFSSISAEYLQKFELLISQGIVATCLRWGGWCSSFCSKFHTLCSSAKIL